MTGKIIPFDLLMSLTSKEVIEEARRSMDITSVSGFHLDARGRLEGAVKPAPPSKEAPAYARITRRGDRLRLECRKHGQGVWCLHTVILALHHIGVEPIFKVVAKERPSNIALGFQIAASFNDSGLVLRLSTRSGGGFLSGPSRFLQREYTALGLDAKAARNLAELSEEQDDTLRITRLDAAGALESLGRARLTNMQGDAYERRSYTGSTPRVHIRISGESIFWKMEPEVSGDCLFLPGWPGYLVSGRLIQRVAGYLPDLQGLVGAASPLEADSDTLLSLMRDRHGVTWGSPKPLLIDDPSDVGLEMKLAGNDLKGHVGLWHEDLFFPMNNLDQRRQIMSSGGRLAVLNTNDFAMTRLRDQVGKARLPMNEHAGFRIREQTAPRFLENLSLPDSWRVARGNVDHFYGLVKLDLQTLWSDGGAPRYKLGEETFDHAALESNLLDNGRGARLPDGRLLSFDIGALLKNQHVMRGVEALHEDEELRQNLLERVNSGEKGEDGPPLTSYWSGLLRPYQLTGVRWLTGNLGRNEPALLADDMGLGKTIQTLAMLQSLHKKDSPQLIVMPTSLLANWREEVARFCPDRVVTSHHGSKRTKDAAILAAADLVLTSYGTMLRDMDLLYDVCFDVVVLDEAQAIKNAASRTATAASELWCNHRVALTGTPVENRMSELWAIFRFLAPGYLGEEEEAKLVTMPGTPAYEALKAKVRPLILRRKKDEVAKDLPAKQEMTVMLPMEAEQAAVYKQHQGQSLSALKANGKTSTISILTRLLRLRQACCHPGLLDESLVRSPSNKVTYLIGQLREIIGNQHSALVFSQFTKLLGLVRFALEEADIPYLYLDGRTTNRQELVHRFQAGEAPVFLISLKAGGVGLNLTRASYVYHLDPWWNPAVEAQATDRAHRIGQKKNVFSYKIISKGTVEERILRMQAGKRFLSEGLWEDADKVFANLDYEALIGLLG